MSDKLTSSLEDYLETIYLILEKNNSVKAIDVSKALGVTRASTTEALKKLANRNLINYGRYNSISITVQGEEAAKEIIAKHQSLYIFFKDILGASHSEAQKNACAIEHIISQDMLKRLIKFTNYYKKTCNNDFKSKFCK